jgi:hypothetical protein
VKTTGDTYGVGISGNVTAQQMSNVTITPHQLSTTTIVSFTVTGPSGTVGFGNMTLPKTAIPYGKHVCLPTYFCLFVWILLPNKPACIVIFRLKIIT